MRYLVGLDLGQAQDPTALVVIERADIREQMPERPAAEIEAVGPVFRYDMRFLKRFPLQMPYPEVMESVKEVVSSPLLADQCTLLVDTTGVGAPVVDVLRLLKLPAKLVPVLITFGTQVRHDGKRWHVPKRNLATAVRMVLEDHRLRISTQLPDHKLLVKELQTFRVKITAKANDTYEAWREGDHDDLVLSTAMCCWYGERKSKKILEGAAPTAASVTQGATVKETRLNEVYTLIEVVPAPEADPAIVQGSWTWGDVRKRRI